MATNQGDSFLTEDGTISRRRLLATAARFGAGAVALSSAGGVLLAACGDSDSNASDSTGPFKLGWIRPTTGLYASGYAPIYVSGLIAVDEINAAGGIMGRQIERSEYDDEGDPAKEPSLVTRLQSDKINYTLGPTGAAQVTASIDAANGKNVIQCAWTNDHRLLLDGTYPFNFGLSWNTLQSSQIAATYLAQTRGLKKLAILREETAFGEIATQTTVDALKSMGIDDVTTVVYPIDAPDMSTYVSKIVEADAEGLFYWGSVLQNTVQVFTALDQQQFAVPIVGQAAMQWQEIIDTAPASITDDTWSVGLKAYTWTDTEAPTQRRVDYAKKVASFEETKAGPQISANSPYYDFPNLLKAVIEDEKTFDVDKIHTALENVKGYDGMVGSITLTPKDHGGLALDQLALLNVGSGRETDKAIGGVFRKRGEL